MTTFSLKLLGYQHSKICILNFGKTYVVETEFLRTVTECTRLYRTKNYNIQRIGLERSNKNYSLNKEIYIYYNKLL
jgi:hypothetical protein